MKKVCIIFGGRSSEHKDSVESFQNLYNKIKIQKEKLSFNLEAIIYVDLQDQAYLNDVDFSRHSDEYLSTGKAIDLFATLRVLKEEKYFLFSTLFSQNGEDGRMQGLCKLIDIESNLGDPLQSSLCLSKYHLNQYVKGVITDIKIPLTWRIDSPDKLESIYEALGGKEVVIKPNALGSSILTDKIALTRENQEVINKMIAKILIHDTYALVQEYIEGEEFTCGVLERAGHVQALPLGRVSTNRKFFGFPEKNDAKLNSKALVNIDDNMVLKKLVQASLNLFGDLDMKNIARFDFIVRQGEIYFLECNQFPSLHQYSFFMLMLGEIGLTIAEVVEIIIQNETLRKYNEPIFDGYINK